MRVRFVDLTAFVDVRGKRTPDASLRVYASPMPRTLFFSERSPFARKVRILLAEKGLAYEPKVEDLTAKSAELLAVSPLGKVPVLVDDDGTPVFDSTVIAEYLEDRYPTPPLLGQGYAERLQHRAMDELSDFVNECTVALFFDKPTGAVLERRERKLDAALDELRARIVDGRAPTQFGLAHAALISALDYHALRLGRARIDARPQLSHWVAPHRARRSIELAPAPTA